MGDVKTVRMERDGKGADVHPDEVENWRGHGWREADSADTSEPKTAGELRDWLTERGVELEDGLKKADLQALYEDHRE